MIRVSWGLALLAVVVVALVARNPRLLIPMAIVFLVWYFVETSRRRR